MPQTQQDPWRYRCKEGHTSWRQSGQGYYCMHCQEHFKDLVDWKQQ